MNMETRKKQISWQMSWLVFGAFLTSTLDPRKVAGPSQTFLVGDSLGGLAQGRGKLLDPIVPEKIKKILGTCFLSIMYSDYTILLYFFRHNYKNFLLYDTEWGVQYTHKIVMFKKHIQLVYFFIPLYT